MSNLGRTTPQEWRLFIALGLPEALRAALTHEQELVAGGGATRRPGCDHWGCT